MDPDTHQNDLDLVGAGVIESKKAPFGELWYNWPFLRFTLDADGGWLRESFPRVTGLMGVFQTPDVRFRWDEVESVEKVRERFAVFDTIRFVLREGARERSGGIGEFEFYAMTSRNEERILDLAESQGASVARS